ncbi:PrpF protein-domain-containing protein [Ilyonectria robusta]|uniref:PrpF protein-domain-containing protein n=1 Tax=Ilyonectria robusta TaxID=1079257 RepID=UPI001E8D2E30|nr:PrpF protein-domain-containing protein [Ilyonectria robusta]KAH8656928.1 PrpF protein-domain-containing protein [Ilyonectria robusta]
MAIQQQMPETRHLTRHVLPCVLMRAGTSKGIFLHRRDLPRRQIEWAPHLISALGSRGNDPRQIDGVGGGTSTTSKVAVVSPSDRPDADVDFTFAQVAVGKESVDFTGTCGNISSGVGPFAVQEGLVKPRPGQTEMDVRIYNTNTKRIIVETVEIDDAGEFEEDGTYNIPGVNTAGSEVKCAFVDPAGSMTGKLFPSGKQQQTLSVEPPSSIPGMAPFGVRVTLIDAANPFVLIDSASISGLLNTLPSPDAQHALIESIRREGAVAMGLASTVEVAAQTRGTPKVALIYPPIFQQTTGEMPDIRVQAYSMGLPHPSLQLTGAVCLAAALNSPGTVPAELSAKSLMSNWALPTPERTPSPPNGPNELKEKEVVIAHSKGTIRVRVVMKEDREIASCAVSRTARRLFEGRVRYYVEEYGV